MSNELKLAAALLLLLFFLCNRVLVLRMLLEVRAVHED